MFKMLSSLNNKNMFQTREQNKKITLWPIHKCFNYAQQLNSSHNTTRATQLHIELLYINVRRR